MAGSEGGGNKGNEDGTDGRTFCVFAEDDDFETRPVRAGTTCCAAAEGNCFEAVPSFCAFVDKDDVRSEGEGPALAIVPAIDAEDENVKVRPAADGQDARGDGGDGPPGIVPRDAGSSSDDEESYAEDDAKTSSRNFAWRQVVTLISWTPMLAFGVSE